MHKKLIIRNLNFSNDLVGLFPDELGAKVSLDLDQSNKINENLGRIIDGILPAYLEYFPAEYKAEGVDFSAISRVTLITVLSLYFDRLYRVYALLDACDDVDSVLSVQKNLKKIKDCIELSDLSANSFDFNQEVICDISEIFNLKQVRVKIKKPQQRKAQSFKNNMFYLKKPSKLKIIIQFLKLYLSKYTGNIGAFELTQTLMPSIENNLFGFRRLSYIKLCTNLKMSESDLDINRNTRSAFIKKTIDVNINIFKDVLNELNLKIDSDVLAENLVNFLIKYIPLSSIEGFSQYFNEYNNLIKNKKFTAVFSTNFAQGVEGLALISAAKKNNIPSIGSQHGGHHGYIENHIIGKECEYKIVDYYVTWGWKDLSDGIIDHGKILNLPSPWYSERILEWRALGGEKSIYIDDKKYDLIFMPNKIYPFTPSPTGGHLTGNHLNLYCRFFKALVTELHNNNIKILHKAYGTTTLNLMPCTIKLLNKRYSKLFHSEYNLEKGISLDLIKRGNVLLWDQPGTGFLECLVLGIPTFVIWSNIFNRSEINSQKLFKDLIDVGIIHHETPTLIKSYLDFKKNKKEWWENDLRQNAIKKFIKYYANTDYNWADIWRLNFIERFQHE